MSNETHAQKPDVKNTERPANKPAATLRDGALKLAIFRNQSEHGAFYSMEPGRIYTDNAGNIQETKSLSGSEPIRMARLLDKGYERVLEFKAELKNQRAKPERER